VKSRLLQSIPGTAGRWRACVSMLAVPAALVLHAPKNDFVSQHAMSGVLRRVCSTDARNTYWSMLGQWVSEALQAPDDPTFHSWFCNTSAMWRLCSASLSLPPTSAVARQRAGPAAAHPKAVADVDAGQALRHERGPQRGRRVQRDPRLGHQHKLLVERVGQRGAQECLPASQAASPRSRPGLQSQKGRGRAARAGHAFVDGWILSRLSDPSSNPVRAPDPAQT